MYDLFYKRDLDQQKLMYLVQNLDKKHKLLLTQAFLINKTG